MIKKIFFILFAAFISSGVAQNTTEKSAEIDFDAIDSLYREDQFYFSVVYSTMQSQPDGFKQSKFSPAISLGFLRDMPINKHRTLAVAAGIGYSLSVYNQNILISQNGTENSYQIIPNDISFSKNKFTFHTLDLPIEFRWRNSTPESTKFWRVYTGVKFSYLFYDAYKLETSSSSLKISNNKDLNPFQYGVYIAAGWNTVNIYGYYGLNSFFKSGTEISGKPLEVNALHFGLMFYIL
jgi:hypothetical protein